MMLMTKQSHVLLGSPQKKPCLAVVGCRDSVLYSPYNDGNLKFYINKVIFFLNISDGTRILLHPHFEHLRTCTL